VSVAKPPAKAAEAPKAAGKGGKEDRARPAPAATVRQDARTTIDTVSAVRRRLEEGSAAGPPVRHARLVLIRALFAAGAWRALPIGRGLRNNPDASGTAAARPTLGTVAGTTPTAVAPSAAAPSAGGDSPQLEQARQMVARGETDAAIGLL